MHLLNSHTTTAVVVGLLATTAVAWPKWEPAGKGDSRSPCPGLNTMANHHIIHHNGRNLNVPDLTQAMMKTFNFDHDLAHFFANFGLAHSPHPESGHFKLADLNKHNAIEHDASLSRGDYHVTGDDHSFNWDNWANVLAYFRGHDTINIKRAALARQHREDTEAMRDPGFVFSGVLRHNSFSESAIYLSAMGSPVTGEAPLSFVREFFEWERLPTMYGWHTTQPATTFDTLDKLIAKIANVTGDNSGDDPSGG